MSATLSTVAHQIHHRPNPPQNYRSRCVQLSDFIVSTFFGVPLASVLIWDTFRWVWQDGGFGWQGVTLDVSNLTYPYFQMRDVLKTEELEIPEGVDVSVKSRLISVTGPRGTLTKNVRHVNMDIRLLTGKTNKVTLAVWQGGRKHVACLRTIRTLINNMIIGVTKVCGPLHSHHTSLILSFQGFRYKMRAVYAHFPINCIIQNDGSLVEIRNFLGEKVCIYQAAWPPY